MGIYNGTWKLKNRTESHPYLQQTENRNLGTLGYSISSVTFIQMVSEQWRNILAKPLIYHYAVPTTKHCTNKSLSSSKVLSFLSPAFMLRHWDVILHAI